ncbi:plasmid mobilization relaxosome protein MobC [Streptomyces specialis]|uniref:plasmid mobilization relaxosome protein MobC n=1 Tax=Streptomyces specialis TaxID=498367 RepID=UPI000B0651F7|nr:plasmid mobilization relaxosome protein MobC [Streptomyces specialis]
MPAFPHRKPRRRRRNTTQRVRRLTTRLSDTEAAEILAAADKRAITAAHFLAAAGLATARGQVTIDTDERLDAAVDELAALRTQVSRVGNNINQIARIHNSGGQVHPRALDHALAVLIRTLARVDAAADTLVTQRAR